jgi:methyltransferase (TIGR00027 family)
MPDSSGEAFAHDDRPSRTSQLVALTRAAMVRPRTPGGDVDAQSRLCAGMPPPPDDWRRPDLEARTRFFDDQVLAAISAGVSQVVILGAGYDDRALRFSSQGVRYFELDHPATQGDKAKRLGSLQRDGERFVLAPVDFRQDDVASLLAAAGHDAGAPSLFICEGLLVYLDQPTIARLLGALRSRAALPSTLAASLAVHREGVDPEQAVVTANSRRRTAMSEPWRTILPAGAHLGLLTRAGWQVEHVEHAGAGSLLVVAGPA